MRLDADDEAPETDRESHVSLGQYPQTEAEPFGLPRPRGAAKVPMATLQRPSSPRLDLTPSPVPRVALTPATGSVDISLVPGPYASRNLPTLAAQHALGRRQRRPAPARTLPPPGRATREPRPSRRVDVRSSKREIVLGLTIGLGLSLVLAAFGQNYLRSDAIANAPVAQELESLTLSARPRAPASDTVERSGAEGAADPLRGERGHDDPTRFAASVPLADGTASSFGASSSGAPSSGASSFGAPSFGASPPEVSGTVGGRPKSDVARHGARPVAGTAGGVWASAAGTRSRSTDSHSADGHVARPAVASEPSLEAGKSPEEAAPERARMSPAESAGLGLDLPL